MKTYKTVAIETDISGIDSNEELAALFTRALEICQTSKASQYCTSSSSTQYLSFPNVTYCIQHAESVELQPVPLPEIDFQEVLDSVRDTFFTKGDQEKETKMEKSEIMDNDSIITDRRESASHLSKDAATYFTTSELESSSLEGDEVVNVLDGHKNTLVRDKIYTNQDTLKPEDRTLNVPVKRYGKGQHNCTHCNKICINFKALRSHVKTQHFSKRPHKCQICGKTFVNRGHLTSHTRTHLEYERFQCSMCDKSFTYKACLDKHSRSHKKENPQKCEFCKKTFVEMEHLAEHLTKSHTGEKPYKCELCDMAFVRKCKLDVHLKIHS